MADLLLELFSEEIPARMQPKARDDFKRMMDKALKDTQLSYETMDAYSTPRRLTLHVTGLPKAQSDVREERRGPKADAPEKAIAGFLGSVGLSRDQVEERADKKGTFLYAVIEKKGAPTADVLADIIPEIIRAFPWPKSMRWGAASQTTESLRWVRPLQSILCVLDGKIVPFDIDGISSGNETKGHRFHAPDILKVVDFGAYSKALSGAKVILDPAERMRQIVKEANALALIGKVEIVRDDALVEENAGLNEWPNVLMGSFDAAFLDVPDEVLTATMRTNQKYFSLRDPKTKNLTNKFLCVSNLEAKDGGRAIIAGNEKVLSARLSDAKFFWDQDLKVSLEDMATKLDAITFHEKLGSVGQKVERVAKLARWLGEEYGIGDPELNERAAKLAKADLVSNMVVEFPSVQGVIGAYYAQKQGEPSDVARAIGEHYAPQGPEDDCPTAPVSVAVALADKIDTLVGFFGIDEKPTGSKDPYALRRAALGVIRLITETGHRIGLRRLIGAATQEGYADTGQALGDFFADRLKVQQREKGVPHDLIDAVFSLGGEDDLVRLLARVNALQSFLRTDDGANLLAGYKRAANILRIEEKKDGVRFDAPVDASRVKEAQEEALFSALTTAQSSVTDAIGQEDFEGAMQALSTLRSPVDAFFDDVTVNADDPALRANRLAMLNAIRETVHRVADFSRIEG